jgi:hypothetical protein
MATSGSREKHKEQKPESVHFWLAIVAGSLFFHSVLMFGVSRAVKVSVAEPGGGAIDVEFVEASGSKAVSEGEPIVPASSFKPEPFRPEPTPLPEFSPEPTPKPSQEVVQKPEPSPEPSPKQPVKPAVKETTPIVSKPEKPEGEKPNKTGNQPTKSDDPIKDDPNKKGTGIQSVRFGAIGTPQLVEEAARLGNIIKAEMSLPNVDNITVDSSFPLRPGQVVNLKLQLVIDNATGRVVLEPEEALATQGDWAAGLNLTENQQITVSEIIKKKLLSMKFPLPKITAAGAGKVGSQKPPETSEWLINFQLTGQ